MPNKDHYRINEAAKFLKVSTKTLRRWGKSGKLVAERSNGGQRFYSMQQLERFKLLNKKHSTLNTEVAKGLPLPARRDLNQSSAALVKVSPWSRRDLTKSLSYVFVASFLIALFIIPGSPIRSGMTSVGSDLSGSPKVSPLSKERPLPSVLAAATSNLLSGYTLNFNSQSIFGDIVTFKKAITAPNVIYSIKAGDGVSVSTGQTPTITNTGVTSFGGSTGSTTLTAGTGVSVSGLTISNSDTGSAQKIFKTISVTGQEDIIASTNTDILTFEATGGATLTTDATTKTLTISSLIPDYSQSGWTKVAGVLGLTNLSDTVNIGSSSFTGGSITGTSGKFTSLDVSSGGITNAGAISGATGFTTSATVRLSGLGLGIIHSNASGVLSSSAVNLSNTDVTGILPTTRGGTGLTAFNAGDIPYASATNILSNLTVGAPSEVLIVSGGIPDWGTVTGGGGGICTNCLVTNPASTQNITPSGTATGLAIRQANGGSVDVFKVTDFAGTTSYLRVDSTGNVQLGSGQTTAGILTVSPVNTDPISISPSAVGANQFTGTITSSDLTGNRTWTFPDLSGIVCTTYGNCTGTSSSVGGSGTINYLSKWTDTYTLGDSIIYDNGTNVGIGTADPTTKLYVVGTGTVTGATTLGSTLGVTGATTLSSTLDVTGTTNLSSTLNVTGATTLGSTASITGNTTIGGNLYQTGLGNSYFSTGNVGIGTATPTEKLTVVGTIASLVATGLDGLKLTDTSDVTKLATKWTATGATLDIPSGSSVNKLTNGGFDTDITTGGWSGHTLYDQFTTAAPTTLVSGVSTLTNGGVITPALSGTELLTNGDMETGSPPTGWVASNATVSSSADAHSGSQSLFVTSTATPGKAFKSAIIANNTWFAISVWAKRGSQGTAQAFDLPSANGGLFATYLTSSSYTNYYRIGRMSGTNTAVNLYSGFNGSIGDNAYFDDISMVPLTLSSLFSTVTEATVNKIISTGVTLTAGTQAGIVLNADATFANFIIAYHDGTKVYFEKNVGGTYSSIFTAVTATYVANATLKVIKLGNAYQVVYNNVLIGSGTVSDAGIVAGTKQGLFSTLSTNSFANFLITTNLDGTLATDGVNTRTVVDTESKLSIASNVLAFASGKTSSAYGNPGLWYPSTTRTTGKVLLTTITPGTRESMFGWDTDQTGVISDNALYFYWGDIRAYDGGSTATIGNFTSTAYQVASILRSTGSYYYIKGGAYTNWTLLWINSSRNNTPLFPGIINYDSSSWTADNLKIPTNLWLPTPLAYDTFTRADGAISSSETTGPDSQTTPSLAWTGGAISTNKNVITPSLGSELWDAPAAAFTSGTYAWVAEGTNTIANVSNALQVTYVDNNNGTKEYFADASDLSSNLTTNTWYAFSVDAKTNASHAYGIQIYDGTGIYTQTSGGLVNTTSVTNPMAFRAMSATAAWVRLFSLTSGSVVTLDNASLKPLTLSSLFSSVSTSTADVIADVTISSLTTGTQAGLVLNLDSTSSPSNFILVYHDGSNLIVDESVSGTYTNKQSTTVALGAGALRVIRYGTKLRVYLNNALVGAELTMTANTNTKHGLFSTYATNTFDNFTLWARGTGNEYVNIPDVDLTATQDTSIHYSGTSSLKLVAGTNDNTYTQNITLPDTATYVLTANVYTTGAAVTSADAALYSDVNGTTPLTTTYTALTNGWYRMQATFTGVASAKNYGVKVMAGKTIYVDSASMIPSAGAGSSMPVLNIANSVTGLGQLAVESTTTLNSGLASLQALIVKGFYGQSANLQEWQSSDGTVLGAVDAYGGLSLSRSTNSLTAYNFKNAAGTSVLDVDTLNGNVGIGTTTPAYNLDVNGSGRINQSLAIGSSASTRTTVYSTTPTAPTATLGSTIYSEPFDSGTGGWSPYSSNTVENDTGTLKNTYVNSGNGAYKYLYSGLTIGNWYELSIDIKTNAGSTIALKWSSPTKPQTNFSNTGFVTNKQQFRAASVNDTVIFTSDMSTGEIAWLDNVSIKTLTLSSLFSTTTYSGSTDITVQANPTLTAGTQAGVTLNLDSGSAPSNFVIAYHDGTKAYLEKVVAGTYTQLIATTTTYVAGATLSVVKTGTSYVLNYNGSQVGTAQTITDAGIINNTLHGLFSTYASNTFTNFSISAVPTLTFTAFSNTGIMSPTTSTLAFTTAGLERARIDANGNLGIGTTAPTATLNVSGSGAKTTSNSGTILSNISTSSTASIIKSGLEITSTGTWNGSSASNIGLYVSSVTGGTTNYDAIFNGGGNVGIGTTAPTTLLDVNGTGKYAQSLTLNSTLDFTNASNAQVTSPTSNTLAFTTAGAEAMRVASNGYVGIGTTTPTAMLDVAGSASISGSLAFTGASPAVINALNGNNISFATSVGGDAGLSTAMTITNAGNVGIGTASPISKLQVNGTISSDVANNVEGLRISTSGVTGTALRYIATGATSTGYIDTQITGANNKFATNPNFDTGITGWDYGNTLEDQFTTAKTSAQLTPDTTTAEPTGQLRTVTDTNGVLSITGGQLSFATGGVGAGNPGLWYPAVTRTTGRILLSDWNIAGSGYPAIGFDTDTSGAPGGHYVYRNANPDLQVSDGTYSPVIFTTSYEITYKWAIILRATGAYYYVKGGAFTNWTLVWISNTNSTTLLYPTISLLTGTTGVYTADNIRIPTNLWLPTPLSYDTFTRTAASGGVSETVGPDSQTTPSLTWTGAGASTNGTQMVITPTTGADLWDADAAAFTSGTYAWTASGTNTIANVSNALEITYVDNGSGATENLNNAADLSSDLTIGQWYQLNVDAKVSAGNNVAIRVADGVTMFAQNITNTTSQTIPMAFLATTTTGATLSQNTMSSGEILWLDNLSLKPLTLTSLFSTVSTSDSDVIADVNITLPQNMGTPAGLVLNLDSMSSPSNFVIVYYDGNRVYLAKSVSGIYTIVNLGLSTYSAGATLRVIKDGTKYRVYYNNVMVGSEQTISDAGIINNTIHGLFSTYSGNTFDNFTLWARGTGAEYTDIPSDNLTVTADTATTYGGSLGSTKIVSTTGGAFTQSVNVGDTASYTLSAAVYTTGSAVTSADVEMFAGTQVLSTTYSALGNGWYRAQATVTGVASAKAYGVYIHAGKTIYLDNLTLVPSAATSTLAVQNSLTGLGQLAVESTSTFNSGLASLQALIVKGALSQTANLAEWQSSASSTLTRVAANGLVDASVGGLATFYKSATGISNADFADTAPNGTLAVNNTDQALFIKTGTSTWKYIAFTGGFQIPVEEAGTLAVGDFLIPYVEGILPDGTLHGLYSKFSDVKGILFKNELDRMASVSAQLVTLNKVAPSFQGSDLDNNQGGDLNQGNGASSEVAEGGSTSKVGLDSFEVDVLVATGAITFGSTVEFQGPAIFNGIAEFLDRSVFHSPVTFAKHVTFGKDTAGFATIPTGAQQISVTFDKDYSATPVLAAFPLWDVTSEEAQNINNYILPKQNYTITEASTHGFTITLQEPAVTDLKFSWTATEMSN